MPERQVESAAAEQAKTDIALLYNDFQIAQTVRRQQRGRMRIGGSSERPHQLVVATMVGVAERFSHDRLIERGGREKEARDWEGQRKQWTILGVDLAKTCPSLSAVRGFYDARTAILHGGGHLTAAQLKEPRYEKVRAHLADAGVVVSQHWVLVDAATAAACVDVCLSFVNEVDSL